MGSQQFCLKWSNHHDNMLNVFEQLLFNEEFVDVTLACEGLSLKAHKMVLSACSPFFQSLFKENPCKHPIVIMKDMNYKDLKAIIDFMYHGQVNVSQDQLSTLLKTAQSLKVKGLAEVEDKEQGEKDGTIFHEMVPKISRAPQQNTLTESHHHLMEAASVNRRKRGRPRRRSGSSHSDVEELLQTKLRHSETSDLLIQEMYSKQISKEERLVPSIPMDVSPPSTESQKIDSCSLSFHASTDQNLCKLVAERSREVLQEGLHVDNETSEVRDQFQTCTSFTQTVTTSTNQTQDEPSPPTILSPSAPANAESAVESTISSHTSTSQMVVSTATLGSLPSTSASELKTTSMLEDIKPVVSSLKDSSTSNCDQSAEKYSVMPYVDSLGMPSLPGPSTYQLDLNLSQTHTHLQQTSSQDHTQQNTLEILQHQYQEIATLHSSLGLPAPLAAAQTVSYEPNKWYLHPRSFPGQRARGYRSLYSHLGEWKKKPVCPHCAKTFYDKSTLNRHVATRACRGFREQL
ncbi:uncharacterized protein LOC143239029 isoform X2 [Tachypleus tridentatus]|uniref:uncharacterized protein LOC143239029 isoform X2 n=1 Tax=Tachypleus tridentatus TaxID=6853 RepID=UPI003FD4E543